MLFFADQYRLVCCVTCLIVVITIIKEVCRLIYENKRIRIQGKKQHIKMSVIVSNEVDVFPAKVMNLLLIFT